MHLLQQQLFSIKLKVNIENVFFNKIINNWKCKFNFQLFQAKRHSSRFTCQIKWTSLQETDYPYCPWIWFFISLKKRYKTTTVYQKCPKWVQLKYCLWKHIYFMVIIASIYLHFARITAINLLILLTKSFHVFLLFLCTVHISDNKQEYSKQQ